MMNTILELPVEAQAKQLISRFELIWSRFYDLSVERELKNFAVGDWVISHFYPEQVLEHGKGYTDVTIFGKKDRRDYPVWPQRAIPVSEEEAQFITANYWAWRYWMITGYESAVVGVLLRDYAMINKAIHDSVAEFDSKTNKVAA